MNRLRAAAALMLLPVLTGGCVVAAVPLVAGGVMARDQLQGDGKKGGKGKEDTGAPVELKTDRARAIVESLGEGPVGKPRAGALPVQGALPAPGTLPAPSGGGAVVAGTGEAAAYSLQAYQALWNHLTLQAERRRKGESLQSVVLMSGTTLDAPRYASCDRKPLAVVFDIDESADRAVDPNAPWRRWKGDGTDAVVATPGAVEGIDAARREGIAVIFTTRRSPESAPGVTGLLDRLGFGGFEPGRTLILAGDAEAAKGDEQVRQVLAAGYCVVALVGDSLNDFSKLFEAASDAGKRQTAATETMVAPLWGAGWFILPNPVRSVATPSNQ